MVAVCSWMIAQIVLEMLPISSSGHLILLHQWLQKRWNTNVEDYFKNHGIRLKTVYYFLHGCTLLVVLFYFKAQWFSFIIPNNTFTMRPFLWVILADLLTAALYVPVTRTSKKFPLIFGFTITAMALLSTAWCFGNKSLLVWDYTDALVFGCAQACALLPGISRLAFTCSVGCWLGFSLLDSFCLSWLIQAPLMAAAFAKSLYELRRNSKRAILLNLPMGLVMLGSSIISYAAFVLVVAMITSNIFYWWGWYMIIPIGCWLLLKWGKK